MRVRRGRQDRRRPLSAVWRRKMVSPRTVMDTVNAQSIIDKLRYLQDLSSVL